jgi:non-ribosomal peptide synthetase component F
MSHQRIPDRPRRRRRALLAAAPLFATLLVTACGGGDAAAPAVAAATTSGAGTSTGTSTGTAGPASAADVERAQLEYARCMRREGVDVPDPAPGSGPIEIAPGQDIDPGTFAAAQKACAAIMERAGVGGELDEQDRQRLEDAALRFARCMREHGVDMPDPTFGRGGALQMRHDTDDPAWRAASEACQSELPKLPGAPS